MATRSGFVDGGNTGRTGHRVEKERRESSKIGKCFLSDHPIRPNRIWNLRPARRPDGDVSTNFARSEARTPSQVKGVKNIRGIFIGARCESGAGCIFCMNAWSCRRASFPPAVSAGGIAGAIFSPPPPDFAPGAREITAQSAERGEKCAVERGESARRDTADAFAASRATRILPTSRRVARARWGKMRRTAGRTPRPRPAGPEAEERAGEAAATRRCDVSSTHFPVAFSAAARRPGSPPRRRRARASNDPTTRETDPNVPSLPAQASGGSGSDGNQSQERDNSAVRFSGSQRNDHDYAMRCARCPPPALRARRATRRNTRDRSRNTSKTTLGPTPRAPTRTSLARRPVDPPRPSATARSA